MVSCWLFDQVADGLFLSRQRRRLAKINQQNALLDATGTPLTCSGAAKATTWRSSRAFSGRCGFNVGETLEINSETNIVSRDKNACEPEINKILTSCNCRPFCLANKYSAWVVDFYVKSTAADPHVLLSVAPCYLPPHGNIKKVLNSFSRPNAEEQAVYDKRMLETPIIWEEPMTFSLDCASSGMYIWSEEWGFFGKRVADKCFLRRGCGRGSADGAPYEAFLRLSWSAHCGDNNAVQSGERRYLNDAPLTIQSTAASGDCDGPLLWGKVAVSVCTNCSSHGDEETSLAAGFNNKNGGGNLGTSDAHGWKPVADFALAWTREHNGVEFTPYVTLMEQGDEVTLL